MWWWACWFFHIYYYTSSTYFLLICEDHHHSFLLLISTYTALKHSYLLLWTEPVFLLPCSSCCLERGKESGRFFHLFPPLAAAVCLRALFFLSSKATHFTLKNTGLKTRARRPLNQRGRPPSLSKHGKVIMKGRARIFETWREWYRARTIFRLPWTVLICFFDITKFDHFWKLFENTVNCESTCCNFNINMNIMRKVSDKWLTEQFIPWTAKHLYNYVWGVYSFHMTQVLVWARWTEIGSRFIQIRSISYSSGVLQEWEIFIEMRVACFAPSFL